MQSEEISRANPVKSLMCDRLEFSRFVLVSENKGKDNSEDQCITREGKPNALPVSVAIHGKVIDYPSAQCSPQKSSDAIGHQHKQSLCAGEYGMI